MSDSLLELRLQGPWEIMDITRVWLDGKEHEVVECDETESSCVYSLKLKPME